MKKKIAVFLIAVALSFVAGMYSWDDSAHSIGMITANGGKVRHATTLRSGQERYMLISTAAVIPPYSGDARVVLEGKPEIDYKLYFSRPVIDLGIRDWPRLEGDILYGLKPKHRIALWVEMRPPSVDPVCGMAHEEHFIRHKHDGKEFAFCNQMCLDTFKKDPKEYVDSDGLTGKYSLAFYDTKSSEQVLRVPLNFVGKGEATNGGGHH